MIVHERDNTRAFHEEVLRDDGSSEGETSLNTSSIQTTTSLQEQYTSLQDIPDEARQQILDKLTKRNINNIRDTNMGDFFVNDNLSILCFRADLKYGPYFCVREIDNTILRYEMKGTSRSGPNEQAIRASIRQGMCCYINLFILFN